MSVVTSSSELFFAQLKALREEKKSSFLSSMRQKAWDRLEQVGLGSKKQEAFQYVPLRHVYDQSYSTSWYGENVEEAILSSVMAESKDSVLVFVDGVFRKDYSRLHALPKQVIVLPLSEAAKSSYGHFLQHRIQKQLQEENDPFVLMNTALFEEGAFVLLPPKVALTTPLQCLYIQTTAKKISLPRVHVVIGAKAQAQIFSTFAFLDQVDTGLICSVLDLSLDEASQCDPLVFMQAPNGVFAFHAVRSTLKKDSRLTCHNFCTGSKALRQDYHISLVGENSRCELKGLSWLYDFNQSHAHVLIDHQAPSSESHQFFKGVLSGASQSSFTGKILVRQEAQKTQAYQLNNNLLLTDGAIAYSKPGLEILADDVKASHGATVSQLDEEQLFYLKTRGLTEKMAKRLLVLGFCKEMFDQVHCLSMQQKLLESIEEYLHTQARHDS